MKVFIAGAHGRTALHLGRMLTQRGDTVRGLIRDSSQRADLEEIGVEPFVGDLASDFLSQLIENTDAVVFAAAGALGKYQQVEHEGVWHLAEAAATKGVRRYVLLSALGAQEPSSWGRAYYDYLKAKADGEQAVRSSGLGWTIVRPGSLTDERGTGQVTVSEQAGGYGSIPRQDVARVLVAVLDLPNTIGKTFEVYSGSTPIEKAVGAL